VRAARLERTAGPSALQCPAALLLESKQGTGGHRAATGRLCGRLGKPRHACRPCGRSLPSSRPLQCSQKRCRCGQCIKCLGTPPTPPARASAPTYQPHPLSAHFPSLPTCVQQVRFVEANGGADLRLCWPPRLVVNGGALACSTNTGSNGNRRASSTMKSRNSQAHAHASRHARLRTDPQPALDSKKVGGTLPHKCSCFSACPSPPRPLRRLCSTAGPTPPMLTLRVQLVGHVLAQHPCVASVLHPAGAIPQPHPRHRLFKHLVQPPQGLLRHSMAQHGNADSESFVQSGASSTTVWCRRLRAPTTQGQTPPPFTLQSAARGPS